MVIATQKLSKFSNKSPEKMYSRSVEQYKKDGSTNSSHIKVKYTICGKSHKEGADCQWQPYGIWHCQWQMVDENFKNDY